MCLLLDVSEAKLNAWGSGVRFEAEKTLQQAIPPNP
jgi:hypothetical protein